MRPRLINILAALALIRMICMSAAGVEITGRVIEQPTGNAVEAARLTVRCVGAPAQTARAVSADDGSFQLRGAFTGPCRIEANKAGYANSLMFTEIEGDLPLVVRLVKGGTISGRVATGAGAPVPRVQVLALRRPDNASISLSVPIGEGDAPPLRVVTDEQGHYRLFGLPPGRYTVGIISATNAQPMVLDQYTIAPTAPPQHLSTLAGESHEGVAFTLTDTGVGTIGGRIHAAGAEGPILVALLPRDLPAAPVARVLADADGSFRFEAVPAGSYLLFAAGPSQGSGGYAGIVGPQGYFARLAVEVTPGNPLDLDVRLEPGRSVSFRLTAPDDVVLPACVASATLRLTSLEVWGGQWARKVQISGAGTTTLRGLAPARYAARLSGLADGCYCSGDVLVDLTGDEPGPITLPLTAGSAVLGRLLPATTETHERAEVVLWPVSSAAEAGLVLLRPNSSGEFAASSIQPGAYKFVVVSEEDWGSPQWRPSVTASADVLLPAGTTKIELPRPTRSAACRAPRHLHDIVSVCMRSCRYRTSTT
jgi:hypothetical protein